MHHRPTVVALAAGLVCASSLDSALAQSCPGDYDLDGKVDASDIGLMLAGWGSDTAGYDLNGDGNVDAADLGLLIAVWGDCPDVQYCHSSAAQVLTTWTGAPIDAEAGGEIVGYPSSPATSEGGVCGTFGFHRRTARGSLVFFETYEVEGDDLLDVYANIRDGGGVEVGGNRYTAYTRWSLEVESGCIDFSASNQSYFGVVDVRLIYVVTLPTWNMPADVSPKEAALWESIVDKLREHELAHVAIGETYKTPLLWEAVGIDGSGFTRTVEGSECPYYYGDSVIPGTDFEAARFESDAVQWLYAGPTFQAMLAAQVQFDVTSGHGGIWEDLSP